MKLAIIGSRELITEEIEKYIPEGVTEIVSGGARGIDSCAKKYAEKKGLKLTEFLPEYNKYKKRRSIEKERKDYRICR